MGVLISVRFAGGGLELLCVLLFFEARAQEEGDMFDETSDKQEALQKAQDASAAISQTGASGDDWNDAEGYYKARPSHESNSS